jgi:Na+/melibiose symporter-like transporter
MLNSMTNRLDTTTFRAADYLKITILGFALAALANVMHAIILPIRIQDFVGTEHKSTYLGLITFAGLIIAIFVQPVAGAISDRARFFWGRRRPFILVGSVAAIIFLFGIGVTDSYVSLFIIWCLTQASLNIVQGPFQAFIPDLVPESKRGIASGIKSFLEIVGGVALLRIIAGLMSNYSTGTGSVWLRLSLGLMGMVLLVMLTITLFTVKEKRSTGGLRLHWSSIINDSFHIQVKTNPAFLLFLVSRLLFLIALTALQTFALYYFEDVVGVSNPAGVTADLITTVGVAMLIVVYPAGRFSDRIGRRPILVVCGLLAALGIAFIFFFPVYHIILFAGVLIGIAAGAFFSTNWALATDLVPKDEAARYLGLTNLATAGGAAIARLIGPIIDFFNGRSTNLGYSILLGGCFAFFILSSLVLWRINVSRYAAIKS